jgi:hypothetical protein
MARLFPIPFLDFTQIQNLRSLFGTFTLHAFLKCHACYMPYSQLKHQQNFNLILIKHLSSYVTASIQPAMLEVRSECHKLNGVCCLSRGSSTSRTETQVTRWNSCYLFAYFCELFNEYDSRADCRPIASNGRAVTNYSQTSVHELNSFLKVVRKPKLFSP